MAGGAGKKGRSEENKVLARNRKARHEYAIDDTIEAGLLLSGTEIKSIRAGKVNLADAYARIERGEAWLVGAHIAPWEGGNRYNHEARRDRKLLLHRDEIDELLGKTKSKGLSLIPLRNRRSGMTTHVGEGMTEFRCGDAVGYGLSEYLDQVE